MRNNRKKPKSTEEKILKQMSLVGVQISELEAQHELMAMTAEDYDKAFLQAVRERKQELIQRGYGDIQHPTKRMFEIGIDSIRQGKPSEQFLRLLEKIANAAEDRDVMNLVFPKAFPRHIRKNTVRAAWRDAKLVEKFKIGIGEYLKQPRQIVRNGKEGLDADWQRSEATYLEAVESYRAKLSEHEKKALDRAIKNQGQELLDYRNWISEIRRTARKR